ncbi:MAG: DHHW family protein [bacterium]|nr:DHHW family protein [bacterium]
MKAKSIITIVLCAAVIFGFTALFLLLPDQQYSVSERRGLAQKPELSAQRLLDGRFMSDFEDYTLDQFPLRDGFRTLKAVTVRYLFARGDNNGLYSVNGYISKLEYPLNEANLNRASEKLNEVYNELIAPTDCKLYLSVIPDKNCFLAPAGGYPSIDFSVIESHMREALPDAEYIDISELVELEDFYFTDQHWRQECVADVAQALLDGMDAPHTDSYETVELETPFYGTYAGQSALPCKPDTIRYLTNDVIEGCKVTSYNTGKAEPAEMYDMDKAVGKDPYEMYLGGADPLIVIENPSCDSGRELVIFRDSFGSSITPLMVEGYSKITMVDMRYMQSSVLKYFIDFSDQDVLFLYSTLILNNSISA